MAMPINAPKTTLNENMNVSAFSEVTTPNAISDTTAHNPANTIPILSIAVPSLMLMRGVLIPHL